MSVNDPRDCGGPAFPVPALPGMSLRDYFAIHAPMSRELLSAFANTTNDGWGSHAHMAQAAYSYADAMLEARQS